MTRPRLGTLAAGLVIDRVWRRVARGGPPVPAPAPRDARARPADVPRRGLLAFTLAALGVGLALMLVFEATLTRIVGVTALFAFIVAGVFLIADPDFIGDEGD